MHSVKAYGSQSRRWRRFLGIAHPGSRAEYRRFLASGKFIASEVADWVAEDPLIELARAQRECDLPRIDELLRRTPSYHDLIDILAGERESGRTVSALVLPRVMPSYLALAEIAGTGVPIPKEGFYATLTRPSVSTFVEMALRQFKEISGGERWVSVGQWLEAMARNEGVHPVLAKIGSRKLRHRGRCASRRKGRRLIRVTMTMPFGCSR